MPISVLTFAGILFTFTIRSFFCEVVWANATVGFRFGERDGVRVANVEKQNPQSARTRILFTLSSLDIQLSVGKTCRRVKTTSNRASTDGNSADFWREPLVFSGFISLS